MQSQIRVTFLDHLKGLAIFLVVWGHSLQYFRGHDYDFANNEVFKIIYSFHMPLFYTISGYFFKSSLKKNFLQVLTSKFNQLIIPSIFWVLLSFLTFNILNNAKFDLYAYFDLLIHPSKWFQWFLRELFISIIISYLTFKLFKKNDLLGIASALLFVFLLPPLDYQRFLLPFFFVGYLLNKYSFQNLKIKRILLSVSLAIFFIMLFYWDFHFSFYVNPTHSLFNLYPLTFNWTAHDFNIYIFRFFIALSGVLSIFYLFELTSKFIRSSKVLTILGENTLSIYLIQSLILEIIISRYVHLQSWNECIYTLVITPLLSAIIIALCLVVKKVFEHTIFQRIL